MKLRGSIKEIEEAKHQHLMNDLLVSTEYLDSFSTLSGIDESLKYILISLINAATREVACCIISL